jgi:hypothetical protein
MIEVQSDQTETLPRQFWKTSVLAMRRVRSSTRNFNLGALKKVHLKKKNSDEKSVKDY